MGIAAAACDDLPQDGTVPDEVAAFAAPYMQDRIWASPAPPSGRIPGADRLVTLARRSGREVSDTERRFPELTRRLPDV
jgi:hypothetical protein